MASPVARHSRFSPDALEAVRSLAGRADQIAKLSDWNVFRTKSREWLEDVDALDTPQLIGLIAFIAAAEDPNPEADRTIPARLQSLRDAVVSLAEFRNSSQLESTIIHLDASTERLNKTVLGLTVVGVMLTAVQAAPVIVDFVSWLGKQF